MIGRKSRCDAWILCCSALCGGSPLVPTRLPLGMPLIKCAPFNMPASLAHVAPMLVMAPPCLSHPCLPLHLPQTASDRLSESRAALERKAALYERLARGEVEAEGERCAASALRAGRALARSARLFAVW